jgi:hypothetical protein
VASSGATALNRYGIVAAGGVVVLTGLGYLVVRWIERRTMGDDRPSVRWPAVP